MANSKKKDKIKDYKASTIIVDIVMLILGLVFFIGGIAGKSQEIFNTLIRIGGAALILACLFEVINFLRIKDKTVFDWVVLIVGAAIGITGLVLVIKPDILTGALEIIFGLITIVYAVIVIIFAASTLRSSKSQYWWFSLLFGMAALVLGILILTGVFTNILSVFIGVALVVAAVGGLANAIMASQAKKEYKAKSKILDDATYTVGTSDTDTASTGKSSDKKSDKKEDKKNDKKTDKK